MSDSNGTIAKQHDGSRPMRPDLTAFLSRPDDLLDAAKVGEIKSYMQKLGHEPTVMNGIWSTLKNKGRAKMTARIGGLMCMIAEGLVVANAAKKNGDSESVNKKLTVSLAGQIAVEIATATVVKEVMNIVGPAVLEIAEQTVENTGQIVEIASATVENAVKIDSVAAEVAEIKARLAEVQVEQERVTREQASQVAQTPLLLTTGFVPPSPSPKPVVMAATKGTSVFHGALERELVAHFEASFRRGNEGDVARVTLLAVKAKHSYEANEQTFLHMIKTHIGVVRGRGRGNVRYWAVSREKLDAAIKRLGGVDLSLAGAWPTGLPMAYILPDKSTDEQAAVEPPPVAVKAPGPVVVKAPDPVTVAAVAAPEPIVVAASEPIVVAAPEPAPFVVATTDLTTPLSPEPSHAAPSRPAKKRGAGKWAKRDWGTDKVVSSPQVLRRFPEITKDQLYRWIGEKKVTASQEGPGSPFKFVSQIVERQIRALLGP